MSVTVVDASALVAVLLVDPNGEAIAAGIAGRKLIAPSLLPFEIANVCAVRARRSPEKSRDYHEALRTFERMDVMTWPVDIVGVFELADRHRLTAYDAAYLWLAREFPAELVTLDKALGQAYREMTGA
jgi:predicted nucleic acid-binding protein